MIDTEIASVVKNINTYELAQKTKYNLELNDNEKTASKLLDEWARDVGASGADERREIAAFVRKTLNEEIYNAPDEILSHLFDRGSIGEFDDYNMTITPKNTLIAYEAAKGGSVDRSYLDVSVVRPKWRNLQLETSLSYADLRLNGWKSVALLTTYANEALKNMMFCTVLEDIDAAVAAGDNCISAGGTTPTAEAMDALALYVNDRNQGNGICIALSKYIQAISKLKSFVSDEMKNEVNLKGTLGQYDAVALYGISGAKKYGNDKLLIPDKRIFGIAGKIGELDMRGDIHVYEDMDNDNEEVGLKIKDFQFGYAFNKTSLDNICKIVCE